MGKEHVCVVTTLDKDKYEGVFTISHTSKYITGFDDPKDLILYKKLGCKNSGVTNVDFEPWEGKKFGDRLGFDTSKQIGESYAEIYRYSWRDEIYVYELYEIET